MRDGDSWNIHQISHNLYSLKIIVRLQLLISVLSNYFSTVKFGFKRSWKLTLWMCACVMRGHTGHKQSMAIARASKKASLINIFKEVFLIKLRLALYDNYSWTRCCWQTYLLKSLQNYRWAKYFHYFHNAQNC